MSSRKTPAHHFTRIALVVLALVLLLSGTLAAQTSAPRTNNPHDLSQENSSRIADWQYRIGDDPAWAQRDLDTADWRSIADLPEDDHEPGIQWYRAEVQLTGDQSDFDILAISATGLVSAYELYWDGDLLESGGVVADSYEDEISGPIKKIIRLKRDQTVPGEHVIAIRLSNFHNRGRRAMGSLLIGYHYNFFYNYSYKSTPRVFVGGASLIAGLFCVAMFFAGSRHRSYLLFALYCFITLFFDVFTLLNLYNEINVQHLRWIFPLIQYGLPLSALAFVVFVVYTYDIPRRIQVIAFAALSTLVLVWLQSHLQIKHILLGELLPILAGALLLFAVYRKTTGSIAALVGVLIWRLFKYPEIMPPVIDSHIFYYVAGDIVLLFCIVLSISRKIHEQTRQLQDIRLRSSRLEVDLLKKNIQPHFILNTLQSITSWIRTKPDNAYQLIEALADEFRVINRIADKTLIPLHQEIDLCRTHLKLMGFRMGADYELVTRGVCDDQPVPPMIFHTLIENALTHSFDTREGGAIHLDCEISAQQTVYRLSNNGSRLKEISRKSQDEIHEGMGLKYIKARLNESFPGHWTLDCSLDDQQWIVTIVIQRHSST
jgi:Histidine kinase